MEMPELIVCAAIEFKNKKTNELLIITGLRHYDPFMHTLLDKLEQQQTLLEETRQGFITNRHRFVDRKEAMVIAVKNQQIRRWSCGRPSDTLFSEDLY